MQKSAYSFIVIFWDFFRILGSLLFSSFRMFFPIVKKIWKKVYIPAHFDSWYLPKIVCPLLDTAGLEFVSSSGMVGRELFFNILIYSGKFDYWQTKICGAVLDKQSARKSPATVSNLRKFPIVLRLFEGLSVLCLHHIHSSGNWRADQCLLLAACLCLTWLPGGLYVSCNT